MFNHKAVGETLTRLGFNQPVKGKEACWVNSSNGVVAFFATYSATGGKCCLYVFCNKLDRLEAFSDSDIEPTYNLLKQKIHGNV